MLPNNIIVIELDDRATGIVPSMRVSYRYIYTS